MDCRVFMEQSISKEGYAAACCEQPVNV